VLKSIGPLVLSAHFALSACRLIVLKGRFASRSLRSRTYKSQFPARGESRVRAKLRNTKPGGSGSGSLFPKCESHYCAGSGYFPSASPIPTGWVWPLAVSFALRMPCTHRPLSLLLSRAAFRTAFFAFWKLSVLYDESQGGGTSYWVLNLVGRGPIRNALCAINRAGQHRRFTIFGDIKLVNM